MKNVIILCEGPTEEGFINNVLYPYFYNINIFVTPITIHTSKNTSSKSFKGGVSKYKMIKEELIKLCKNPNYIVTTMFDYYGMPKDTPSIECNVADIHIRARTIENAINNDIGYSNLLFNLVLHEFEGLLFSNPQAFDCITNNNILLKLQAIKDKALTPEHINNSVDTAPSKRILNLIPDYAKVRQGTIIAKKIGIDKIISECPHFAEWIENIKNFNPKINTGG